MKNKFLGDLDNWWDVIGDVYTDTTNGFEITYRFNSPQTFNEVTVPSDTLKISGVIENIKASEYRGMSVTLQLLIKNITLGDIKLDIPENEYIISLRIEYTDIKNRNVLKLYDFQYNIIKETSDKLQNLDVLFTDRENLDSIYRTHYVTFNDTLINNITTAINSIDISYYKPDIREEKHQQKEYIINYIEKYR